MISSKTKKLPVKQNGPRVKRGRGLSGADVESVIAIVRDVFPQLAIECRSYNIEQAEEAIRNTMFAKRVGPVFEYDEPGEPNLIAVDEGLRVAHQGRGGTVTWLDVASEFCTNDFEDEDSQRDPGAEPESPRSKKPIEFRNDVVAIEKIITSKDNPRSVFDDAKLAELAASMKSVGVLEPLVVRQSIDGRFELVAGERRLRAAKLAGLKEVPVRVGFLMTPEEADEIRVIENLQREDLSAIEEARGFERMLKAHSYTQEKLAERLGVSQPHIANRLRLLKLPEKWQQRVISQEILPTHARAILPYVERPALMEAIDKEYYDKKGKLRDPNGVGSVSHFEDNVEWTLRRVTEPMTGTANYCSELGDFPKIFTPTKEQREQLEIVEIDGKSYACNVKLWKSLQAAHVKQLIANRGKAAKAKKQGADGTPRELTPAEKKAAAKKQAEQFKRRLDEWRTNWLRWLLSRAVYDKPRVALAAVVMAIGSHAGGKIDAERIAELLHLDGKATKRDSANPWRNAASDAVNQGIATAEPAELLVQFAADWLWDDKQNAPRTTFSREQLEPLAIAAGFDLEAEWYKNLAGELTTAYFNLHNKEQLIAIADELSINELDECTPNRPKSELVQILMLSGCTHDAMPEEIKRLEGCVPGTKPKPKKAKAGK